MSKAQAALEFLTTYGWMILILIVVMGALLYLGMFIIPKYPSCVFPANFVCRGWKLTTSGNFTLDLYQNTGHPINVRGINCTKGSVETNPQLTAVEIFIKNNDHERIANGTNLQCLDENGLAVTGSVGSAYSGKLLVYYTENDTGVTHLVVGSITARYE